METPKRFVKNVKAATAVEYALMVALIAIIIIISVTFLGTTVANTFNFIGDAIGAITI